ncbi:MAG: nucleotidyltransferase family protein [Candidatus Cryptobacteroides sp.]
MNKSFNKSAQDILYQRFFSLLRAGLFKRSIDTNLFKEDVDWPSVMRLAEEQTVSAIIFDGVSQLPKEYLPDKSVLMSWLGTIINIENNNRRLNQGIVDVVERYNVAGIFPVLLKGQGIGQYYPNPLHRNAGDIDLYFADGIDVPNKLASTWDGVTFHEATSHHVAFNWKEFVIENHNSFFSFYNSSNQKQWEKVKQLVPIGSNEYLRIENHSIPIPSPQMNALYIFLHLWHHCQQKGVGIRHVCDWLCLWKACEQNIDKQLFLETVDMLPIKRPMTAVAWIGENYLGFEPGIIPLDTNTKQARKDGDLLLKDILHMGNFGRSTDMMKGFQRGHHLNNLRTYVLAFKRQMGLFHLCPSEIIAYPIKWFISYLK